MYRTCRTETHVVDERLNTTLRSLILLRLWRYISHVLTYLLTYLLTYIDRFTDHSVQRSKACK